MIKNILISFLLLFQFEAEAQDSWIEYIKSLRNQFCYKDTVIVKFKSGVLLDTTLALVSMNENYHNIFTLNEDTLPTEQNIAEKYFYSYYLSKSNFATLVLYTNGMWNVTGNLYLYNFSPQGKLLKQIKLQDGWGDAGESYFTNSKFENDSIFKVIHADGFEKPDQSYNYEITEWNYLINGDGIIQQKSIRKYEKNADLFDFDNRIFR